MANGEVYLGDNPSNIQIKPLGKITDSSEAKAEEKPNSHHEENHQSPRKISHGQKNGASKIMKGYSHELIEHHRKEEEKVKGNERENRPEDKKLEKIELQEQNTSRKLTEQSGNGVQMINSTKQQNFYNWCKLKAYADNKIKLVEIMIFVLDRIENIVGKGVFAGFQNRIFDSQLTLVEDS